MISSQDKLIHDEGTFGSKAQRLIELINVGHNVPPFLIITSEEISQIFANGLGGDAIGIKKLTTEISTKLLCDKYAVRSSMKIEDLGDSSQAGQFKTVLDVSLNNLEESILSVIMDANKKLPHGLADCSIIIQQFIKPDYAGVIFTRNPINGREMVVEYCSGIGDKVVGGEDVTRIHYLHYDAKNYAGILTNIKKLSDTAHEIERMYDCPQDIEWAQKGGTTYILQTRPITSITKGMWRGIENAESSLLSHDKFYFEKTSTSETFARPRPLALSILRMLHTKGGSVDRAYKHIGVKYSAHEQLFHIFGNELFVDRHIEIQTLFPSLGYKKINKETPGWETWRGTIITLKNILSLAQIQPKQHIKHERLLCLMGNELPVEPLSVAGNLSVLTEHYSTIFEINIFAQKALANIEKHLGRDSHYLSGLLITEGVTNKNNTSALIGNSLNIDDVTPFLSRKSSNDSRDTATVDTWWNSLPKWKRIGLTSCLDYARKYMKLRELARIHSVVLIDNLRKSVEKQGIKLFPDAPDLVYFATIDELIEGTVRRNFCEERKRLYREAMSIESPSYFASFVKSTKKTSHNIGVSSGIGEGVFVTKANIGTVTGKKILYTEVLSPDIVQYFDSIVGIVSNSGGMLSHLAIMAREAKIPVVVTNSSKAIPFGKIGSINGLTGELKIL